MKTVLEFFVRSVMALAKYVSVMAASSTDAPVKKTNMAKKYVIELSAQDMLSIVVHDDLLAVNKVLVWLKRNDETYLLVMDISSASVFSAMNVITEWRKSYDLKFDRVDEARMRQSLETVSNEIQQALYKSP